MAQAVRHQQIFKPGIFGGVTNRTLCGRVSNASDDMNIEVEGEGVTCKLCTRLIVEGKSPLLKYIGWRPPA